MSVGRPSGYSAEIVEAICDRIASGESLRKICKLVSMPSRMTVLRWLDANPDFVTKYARAREMQADAMDDLILETANACTSRNAMAARVKIDAYKWRAMKLKPKVYGDKQEIEHTGGVTIQSTPVDERL